jgi:glycosyltransferase involved in cell wall biosynthesis
LERTNQPRITILAVINELLFGGDENRLLTIARHMDKAQYRLGIVTLRSEREYNSRFGSLRSQYEKSGVRLQNLGLNAKNHGRAKNHPLRQLHRLRLLSKALSGLIRIVRTKDIDIISAHTGPGFLSALLLNLICKVPYTITTYNVREEWHPLWLWKLVHRLTLQKASAIITDSQAVADDIRKNVVPNHRRIKVIPNGVALPASEYSRETMRERFDIPTGSHIRVVGQISTLVPTKGQAVLLRAAAPVLRRHPDTYFLFVGFTRSDALTYTDELKSLARSLGILQKIRFVSYDGPISDPWQAIDIQVHPTFLDSLPQAIIEGMSLGKPCIASAFAGIPTMIDHGKSGFLIEPGDSKALARHLNMLLDDPQKIRTMGAVARRRYENTYTIEHMTRALDSVYRAIMREQRGSIS